MPPGDGGELRWNGAGIAGSICARGSNDVGGGWGGVECERGERGTPEVARSHSQISR